MNVQIIGSLREGISVKEGVESMAPAQESLAVRCFRAAVRAIKWFLSQFGIVFFEKEYAKEYFLERRAPKEIAKALQTHEPFNSTKLSFILTKNDQYITSIHFEGLDVKKMKEAVLKEIRERLHDQTIGEEDRYEMNFLRINEEGYSDVSRLTCMPMHNSVQPSQFRRVMSSFTQEDAKIQIRCFLGLTEENQEIEESFLDFFGNCYDSPNRIEGDSLTITEVEVL